MSSLAGLALALLALSAATAVEPLPLALGESAEIADSDLRLTFTEVRGDNRCPKDVQCIVAGEAKVVFTVETEGGESSEVVFAVPPGGGAKSRFRDWDLEIQKLLPEPVAGEKIEPADYVAHVAVTPAGEEP